MAKLTMCRKRENKDKVIVSSTMSLTGIARKMHLVAKRTFNVISVISIIHLNKDCYAWKREKGKGKEKGSSNAQVHAIEDRPKSSIKIEELNVVTHDSDSQDILALDQPLEIFHDAQESLCLESTISVEILVSGEISHAWIMDSGASLHVKLHRE